MPWKVSSRTYSSIHAFTQLLLIIYTFNPIYKLDLLNASICKCICSGNDEWFASMEVDGEGKQS